MTKKNRMTPQEREDWLANQELIKQHRGINMSDNMTSEQFARFRDTLRNGLYNDLRGVWITYIDDDGNERLMLGTLDKHKVPAEVETLCSVTSDVVQPIYDIKKGHFIALQWNKIKCVEFGEWDLLT